MVKRRKANPIARSLRSPHLQPKIIPDKRKLEQNKELKKELKNVRIDR